jgi:hypothetical protein
MNARGSFTSPMSIIRRNISPLPPVPMALFRKETLHIRRLGRPDGNVAIVQENEKTPGVAKVTANRRAAQLLFA